MTARHGYVWFLLSSWYSDDWWDVDYHNGMPGVGESTPQEKVPCTTSQMKEAVDGYFVVAKAFYDTEDTQVAGGITVRDFRRMYRERAGREVIIFIQLFKNVYMLLISGCNYL